MSVEHYGIGIMLGTGEHVEAGCIINLPAKSSAALPTGNPMKYIIIYIYVMYASKSKTIYYILI